MMVGPEDVLSYKYEWGIVMTSQVFFKSQLKKKKIFGIVNQLLNDQFFVLMKCCVLLLLSNADVRNDPLSEQRQFPALSLDLSESRTLLDPINPMGHTQEINLRSRMWGEAHRKYKDPPPPLHSLGRLTP